MAEAKKEQTSAVAQTQSASRSLLDEAIIATPQTSPDRVKEMMEALADAALKGIATWDKNVNRTLKKAIAAVDEMLSKQLAVIMHAPEFQKLEGTWRGFRYLVYNSETSSQLKIKVLNVSKQDLAKDLEKAEEFDQSQMFKKLYEDQYGMFGGEPYGALVGDYEFTNHPEDIEVLTKMAGIAAGAFCPFISAASPKMFGMKSYTELAKPRDMEQIFQSKEYTKWRSFRDFEDSRFVTLVMPRVIARDPYGANSKHVEEFNFEETELDASGQSKPVPHDHYCWMNAAYAMVQRLTTAYSLYGWCTAIRGAEGGGKVEGLPLHTFLTEDGDLDLKCPTEIALTERREGELSKLGFLPLCHYKNTDYAVFVGAQTTQKPKKYDNTNATDNAQISARLPYIMAMSRIAHFLKVIARDKIGSFMEASDCQDFMRRWIATYVNADAKPTPEMKARYPLAEARIDVHEIPGSPGSYNAVAWLRPWLQMEELSTSLRLVAKLPAAAK